MTCCHLSRRRRSISTTSASLTRPRLTTTGPVVSRGTPLARDSSEVGRSALECSAGTTKACCSSAVSTASVVMVASSPWSVGAETGYTIDTFAKPRLSLRANIISGNRSADSANLQTFNPLFPKGKYFGELTPVGPCNLINLVGAVGLKLSDQIAVYVQGGPLLALRRTRCRLRLRWKYCSRLRFRSRRYKQRTLSRNPTGICSRVKSRQGFAFLISYSQFAPGSFVRDTRPSETIHFFAAGASFQF
jgi:Alginate export